MLDVERSLSEPSTELKLIGNSMTSSFGLNCAQCLCRGKIGRVRDEQYLENGMFAELFLSGVLLCTVRSLN